MISLLLSFVVLIIGYNVYGRVVENVFSPDDRDTPAIRLNDGVDHIPMKTWKAFLVQLLNIAGFCLRISAQTSRILIFVAPFSLNLRSA